MKIVVNHLTRMQKGFICVAGIDLATGRHVRPLLRQQMRTALLARNGGPFDIGCIVDLGRTRKIGKPPEVEDHLFFAPQAARLGDMNAGQFWERLCQLARSTLIEIFGKDLKRRGSRSCAVDVGGGQASLGCYIPSQPQLVLEEKNGRERIRIRFRGGSYEFDVPVTDIRLYADDHVTPDSTVVRRTAERLQAAGDTILSVGLGRAFKKRAGEPALHWLQVNNLHFRDDPCWKLG